MILKTFLKKIRELQGQIGRRNRGGLLLLVASVFVLGGGWFCATGQDYTNGFNNGISNGTPSVLRPVFCKAIYIRVIDTWELTTDIFLNFFDAMVFSYKQGFYAFWWLAGSFCFCIAWVLFLMGAHYRLFFRHLLARGGFLGGSPEALNSRVFMPRPKLAVYVRIVSFFNDKWHIDILANNFSAGVLYLSSWLKAKVEPRLFLSLFWWVIKLHFYLLIYLSSLFTFFIASIFQFLILWGYFYAVQVVLEYVLEPAWVIWYAHLIVVARGDYTVREMDQLNATWARETFLLNSWHEFFLPQWCYFLAGIALFLMGLVRFIFFFAFSDKRLDYFDASYRRMLVIAGIPERLYYWLLSVFSEPVSVFRKCEERYYILGLRALSQLRIGSLTLRNVMLLSLLLMLVICIFILI